MKEQYPFFRDADEQTRAVIGEEAVNADLDGTYQKPYAILTQKRLYCKNEAGNFITEADTLRSAKKGQLPGQNWFLWGTVACSVLMLAILCFWYWGRSGSRDIREMDARAQGYIDYYQALKEKIPEYEQTIEDHASAQKEIEQLQQEWEKIDYAKFQQEAEQAAQEAEQVAQEAVKLKAVLDEAVEARNSQEQIVKREEKLIADYEREIAEAEETISKTDVEENNKIEPQITELQNKRAYYEGLKGHSGPGMGPFEYWRKNGIPYESGRDEKGKMYFVMEDSGRLYNNSDAWSFFSGKIQTIDGEIAVLQRSYVNIESLERQIWWNQMYIEESQANLAEYRQQLDEAQKAVDAAQAEVTGFQPKVKEAEAKVNEADVFLAEIEQKQAEIEQKQAALERIPLAAAKDNIQRFEDSKADYKNAKSVQRKVRLFSPCLLAFVICAVAGVVLLIVKKIKLAVLAALASAVIGLLCTVLTNAILRGFGWGIWPPLWTIALQILLVFVVALSVLTLWWDRKRTVYQITHTTGVFNFTPSQYPAEEFKNFTTQVEELKTGETVHD